MVDDLNSEFGESGVDSLEPRANSTSYEFRHCNFGASPNSREAGAGVSTEAAKPWWVDVVVAMIPIVVPVLVGLVVQKINQSGRARVPKINPTAERMAAQKSKGGV